MLCKNILKSVKKDLKIQMPEFWNNCVNKALHNNSLVYSMLNRHKIPKTIYNINKLP